MAGPQRVVIVGVGLLGGSLGLALRRRTRARVIGLSHRPGTVLRARRRGVFHEGHTDPARALPGADIVVFCTPVETIVPLARRFAVHFDPNALVMDVGSVKGPIVGGMASVFREPAGAHFIGAHPMAGSEKSGVENAAADLFVGATCALTPTGAARPRAIRRAADFWRSVGARPIVVAPDVHDRAVALVSHLPHLIADALALTAGRWGATPSERKTLRSLAAGSFRDATRVAGADPDLWRGIFDSNAAPLKRAARDFQRTLGGLVGRRWPRTDLRAAQRFHDEFHGS